MILAGDVGGTKTVLGLFRVGRERLEPVRSDTFPSPDFPGLEQILAEFLAGERKDVDAACFGIPGPVIANHAKTTNLTWEVDGASLSRSSGIPRVELVNDLMATAEGLALLGPGEIETLQEDRHKGDPGAVALIAPGTGLGMCVLARADGGLVPQPSEGGHIDFAARNEEEWDLLRFLRRRFGRVSVERVLSGPGLLNLYEYLREAGHAPENPALLEEIQAGDPGGVIGRAALAGEDALCVHALELFVSILGATAGNVALLALSSGGVYLGGGIPPKILPKLREAAFLDAFADKGRYTKMLRTYAVRVVLNERTALLGAARRAARLVGRA
jgi:glucokinase